MASSMRDQQRRAEHFKVLTIKLRHRVAVLEQEAKVARTAGYIAGSASMMAGVHTALNDGDLSAWLSNRLLSARVRVAPFHLSPEKEAMVRTELSALCKACGIKSNVEDILI